MSRPNSLPIDVNSSITCCARLSAVATASVMYVTPQIMEKTFKVNIIEDPKAAAMKVTAVLR